MYIYGSKIGNGGEMLINKLQQHFVNKFGDTIETKSLPVLNLQTNDLYRGVRNSSARDIALSYFFKKGLNTLKMITKLNNIPSNCQIELRKWSSGNGVPEMTKT